MPGAPCRVDPAKIPRGSLLAFFLPDSLICVPLQNPFRIPMKHFLPLSLLLLILMPACERHSVENSLAFDLKKKLGPKIAAAETHGDSAHAHGDNHAPHAEKHEEKHAEEKPAVAESTPLPQQASPLFPAAPTPTPEAE